jgi:hypothetical protein
MLLISYMPDLQKLQHNKDKIISVIQSKGPSFPARVARETGITPLFVAAFLAELVSERRLKISNMKVGSSPIYYLSEQEQELEKFSDYLNHKEREAFSLLKESEILDDQKQQPAIRVALRGLKDFAIPITARINGENKLFWKYFSFPSDQTQSRIQKTISTKQEPPIIKQMSQVINKEETKLEPIFSEESVQKNLQSPSLKIKKAKALPDHQFPNQIKKHLSEKNIELLQEISYKKKELIAKIRTDSRFGKQEFYLIAKDKKKITENDLTIALQKAHSEKMPAFIMSPGELDKKAQIHHEQWRNLLKFEQISS